MPLLVLSYVTISANIEIPGKWEPSRYVSVLLTAVTDRIEARYSAFANGSSKPCPACRRLLAYVKSPTGSDAVSTSDSNHTAFS